MVINSSVPVWQHDQITHTCEPYAGLVILTSCFLLLHSFACCFWKKKHVFMFTSDIWLFETMCLLLKIINVGGQCYWLSLGTQRHCYNVNDQSLLICFWLTFQVILINIQMIQLHVIQIIWRAVLGWKLKVILIHSKLKVCLAYVVCERLQTISMLL